jgi:hypothetical protein
MFNTPIKRRKWCRDCDRYVLAATNPTTCAENTAHGCLVLLTLGLWIPVALVYMMMRSSTYLCPQCGQRC